MYSLFFTGHRPQRLGGYNATAHHDAIQERLEMLIADAYKCGYRKFYSGGALGTDQIAAKAVLNIQVGLHSDVELIMALPFEGFWSKWPAQSQNALKALIERANSVVYVSPPPYTPVKMQVRNVYMVDNSACGIGVWDGSTGGTKNCIDYTLSVGKMVCVVNPNTLAFEWIGGK